MQILIVVVDHQFQNLGPPTISTAIPPGTEQADRDRFEAFLTDRLRQMGTGLIAEEWTPGRPSIPGEIAATLGIRHECVDMSLEERERNGIPARYAVDPHLTEAQKKPFHIKREKHMVSRTEEVAHGVTACIFICGATHTEGLARLFSQQGHSVECVNFLEEPGLDLRWLDSRLRTG